MKNIFKFITSGRAPYTSFKGVTKAQLSVMEHPEETKTNTEVELLKKEETTVEEDEKISTTQTFYESDNEEEDVKPDVDLIRKDLMEHALRMGFVSSGKTEEGDVKGDLGKRKSNSAPLDTLFGGGADGCVKKVKKEEPFDEDFKSSIVKTEDGTNVKKVKTVMHY